MADKNTKLYMEMQMEELKAALGAEADDAKEDSVIETVKVSSAEKNNRTKQNADLAKLYEDAAEYEAELECFEKELEIIEANELKNIAEVLTQQLPDEERNYAQELKAVLVAGWTHLIETNKTYPQEHLALIKETDFCDVVEKLNSTYPDYDGDFDADVREVLTKRWNTLIAIKKEHIEEEMEEIYIAGLKPSFVKRMYKKFHGIS